MCCGFIFHNYFSSNSLIHEKQKQFGETDRGASLTPGQTCAGLHVDIFVFSVGAARSSCSASVIDIPAPVRNVPLAERTAGDGERGEEEAEEEEESTERVLATISTRLLYLILIHAVSPRASVRELPREGDIHSTLCAAPARRVTRGERAFPPPKINGGDPSPPPKGKP